MKYSFCLLLLLACGVFAELKSPLTAAFLKPRYQKGLDLCPTCIQFSEQAINQLLNIVLNAGVVGSCSELCGLLTNKTHSQPLGVACSLVCDFVGIQAFSKLIEKADLDPIYYCELLRLCTVKDDGNAVITNMTVTPEKGPVGTAFKVMITYNSTKGTGTGELNVEIDTVDGVPLDSAYLMEPQAPGVYQASVQVKASPDPDCDPTQDICEQWLPGTYKVNVALCNGECGSHHPHSQVYDAKTTSFTVVEN